MTLALEAYCRHRTAISEQDHHTEPVQPPPPAAPAGELALTGTAVPAVELGWLGGWLFEVAGIPLHVTEASAGPGVIAGVNDREAGSDPAEPPPAPGTRVHMRAVVSVADGYVVDEVEQAWNRPMTRPWLVQRIVRLRPARRSVAHTGVNNDYLIDLASPR
ncbi:hypothetical protein [Actinoplanes aureus]|uniref:Uncharacterized protein n=1 Tax=Actinoplanes aureus TaxID=2792083 RepID=A0A931CK74_9ACTN|nr:hypothetical protein [Actinoplanes aureus]MBG0566455.1 hypothetical protein [Actinoplanes aureus]